MRSEGSFLVFLRSQQLSGAFNPSVTIAMGIRRILTPRAAAFYVIAELVGGLLGGVLCHAFLAKGVATIPAVRAPYSLAQGFFSELFCTFLLASAVLHTGCSRDNEGNSFFGLTIGGTLVLSALVFGPISGAVLNPAVGMLSLLAGISAGNPRVPSSAWIYFVAPPLAGGLAALVFRLLSPRDHAPREHLMKGPVDRDMSPVQSSTDYTTIVNSTDPFGGQPRSL